MCVNDRSFTCCDTFSFSRDSQKIFQRFTIPKLFLGIDWNTRRVCLNDQSCESSWFIDARSCLRFGQSKKYGTFGFKHGGAFEMYIAQVIVNFAWYILKVKCTVQTRRLMLQSLNALTPRAVYKINLIASASGNNISSVFPLPRNCAINSAANSFASNIYSKILV